MFIPDISASCHFDPVRYMNFEKFSSILPDDFCLVVGLPQWKRLEEFSKNYKIIYLNFEEPNGLFSLNNLSCHAYEDIIYKMFTKCPYTVEYMNKKFNNNKRIFMHEPFAEENIPVNFEKEYDVFYSGCLVSNEIEKILEIISKFKYCHVYYNPQKYITHLDAEYKTKLSLLAKSKIYVLTNLLFPRPNHIRDAHSAYDDIFTNKAYENKTNMFGEKIMPQIKSRLWEAAFCKSLILCRRDPWNVVENWFVPGKEFLYYDDYKNLQNIISNILSNYSSYKEIIENAYEKACNNYTTRHFVEKYLKPLGD